MTPKRRRRRGKGSIRQLPSGAYQARFSHDGQHCSRTMDSKAAAQAWLKKQSDSAADGSWTPPDAVPHETGAPHFSDYAEDWVEHRSLAPRTRSDYRRMIANHLDPVFGNQRLNRITVTEVRQWHRTLLPDAPTMRARVYGLLRTIMQTAWQDDVIPANPCRIRGAGSVKRKTRTEVPTPFQIHELADAMPTEKYRIMVLISAWCGLRFGETTELRGKDIVSEGPHPVRIKVRRAVSRVDGEFVVGPPKSEAGVRDVVIPPHIRADLAAYLDNEGGGNEDLLFPGTRNGTHLAPSSLYKPFYKVRQEIGLSTLRWHDLRHFAGTTAAQAGGTLAEVQGRLGHSTAQAAMRYQHAASERDEQIADRLSNVIRLKRRGA